MSERTKRSAVLVGVGRSQEGWQDEQKGAPLINNFHLAENFRRGVNPHEPPPEYTVSVVTD